MCSQPGKEMEVAAGNCFAENRATLHLHGGISPWISDGTPHQWITPAAEYGPLGEPGYDKGASVSYVPDMWFVDGVMITDPSCAGRTTPAHGR